MTSLQGEKQGSDEKGLQYFVITVLTVCQMKKNPYVKLCLADSLVGDPRYTWTDETEWKWRREERAETRKVQEREEMRRAGRGPDEAAKQLSLEHFLYSPAAALILISLLK